MGYSDLGCYGGEIKTPNLDKLAAGGLRFTQFYNTARCCPTRAALLTGLYPHQAGIGHMMDDRGHDGYRGDLNRRCATIAEVLKPAGYGTYAVGKWHVTRHIKPDGPKHNWPLQRGFDRFYGTITGAGSFFDPGTLTRDNTNLSPFTDTEYQPKRYYYTDAITDHAIQFVGEHCQKKAEQPFLLYMAYTAAHWPMHALEEDIAKYRGAYDAGYDAIRQTRVKRLRESGLMPKAWTTAPTIGDWSKPAGKAENRAWEIRCMEVYAAMIDRMDQNIGRFVAELSRHGKLDNTLILFLQDNGGCQEVIGRQGQMTRPEKPTLPPIAADAIRLDVIPKQTRGSANSARPERAARSRRHLHRLRIELGQRLEYAISRVQALRPRRRHLDAVDCSLAEGHRTARRVRASTGTLDRHHGDLRRFVRCDVSAHAAIRADSTTRRTQPRAGIRGQEDRTGRDLLGTRREPRHSSRRLETGRQGRQALGVVRPRRRPYRAA